MVKKKSENYETIVDIVRDHARNYPKKKAYVFLKDGETEDSIITYKELDKYAQVIASRLSLKNYKGERALLLFPSGLEFIIAFLGCLYAGVIAVPVHLPNNGTRIQQALPKIGSIVKNAGPAFVLTTVEISNLIQNLFSENEVFSDLSCITTDNIDYNSNFEYIRPNISKDSLAFLQYTSGSTGLPKGVMVSHGNLVHNEEMIKKSFDHKGMPIIVGWLPFYHDMGLIGNVLQPLYLGTTCILMPPVSFIQKPYRWLKAISDYKAVTSGGPNFAYALCVNKITDEERATLDLSSWKLAFNGSEPVDFDTMRKFSNTFKDCGFCESAFYPCYGLAETTLFVTGGKKEAPLKVFNVVDALLEQNKVMESASIEDSHPIVSCGQPWLGQKVAIVDTESLEVCPDGKAGEIWVSGDSIAKGYWSNKKETNKIFKNRLKGYKNREFLRTGDIGTILNGEVLVIGRYKDLIIIRGRNHHPHDIEKSVENCFSEFRIGSCAAFGIRENGEERLFIAQEIKPSMIMKYPQKDIFDHIRKTIFENHEIQSYCIILVRIGSIPKTSSGKKQRSLLTSKYQQGEISIIAKDMPESIKDSSVNQVTKISLKKLNSLGLKERRELVAKFILQLIANNLGIDSNTINSDEQLRYYGLDSINTIIIHQILSEEFNINLSLNLLTNGCSISGLTNEICNKIDNVYKNKEGIPESQPEYPPIREDSQLDKNIKPVSAKLSAPKIVRNILLTGVTGHLGAFLLRDLISMTKAKIFCLVRSNNCSEGLNKIENNLKKYSLWDPGMKDRIKVLLGDLSKAKLGLNDTDYASFSKAIDLIFHSAADVNFIYPYSVLKPVNVKGTEEILKFATKSKLIPVHYMSSVGVLLSENEVVYEVDELEYKDNLSNGYEQSKWVGDKMVETAIKRGIPGCIYRLGLLTGNGDTGVYKNYNEFISTMIKGCIQMGYFPAIEAMLEIIPIDFVSKAIIQIALDRKNLGKKFHINHPQPMKIKDMGKWVKDYGYSVEPLTWNEWKKSFFALPTEVFRKNAVYPYKSFIQSMTTDQATLPEIDISNFLKFIEKKNLECPSTEEMLDKYLAYFIRIGFLEAPKNKNKHLLRK